MIDAAMGARDGVFCFCPITGDIDGEFSVVTGFNYLGELPPEYMSFVAVIHEDGSDAMERFYTEHRKAIDKVVAEQQIRNRISEQRASNTTAAQKRFKSSNAVKTISK